MPTLQDLREQVIINIGGRRDSQALLIINNAINAAAAVAALVFEPPELREVATTAVNPGQSELSLGTWPDLLEVIALHNVTDNAPLWFMPYEQWHLLPAASTLKFYSVYGDRVYLRAAPSSSKTLRVSYSRYPTKLVNPNDALDFEWHDSYIVAVASAITMAAFEETESANMWAAIAESLSLPFTKGQKARQIIAGQKVAFEALK